MAHIFVSYRSQPLDQAGYSECDYFPAAHVGVSAEPLLQTDAQLLQANFATESSNRFSHPSSSDALPDMGYHRPQPLAADGSYLYPTTCFKYRHCSAATSSVITHTGSTVNMLSPSVQAHFYPEPEAFSLGPYAGLGYPAVPGGPAVPPPYSPERSFPAPDQSGKDSRGKYKQTTPGAKTLSSAPSASPLETSCLAKLLSTGMQERAYIFVRLPPYTRVSLS
ncbi:hypothetical protein Z043_113779 [Scleropages formosus]|uniref:Uncharacterized protein n=1 Tax=Scleropages formosus TaxID=113540 RepID=A0A0P7U0M3_SCLFO|nr:hypothetical protein Z043_113779 [Scleropages formosus]